MCFIIVPMVAVTQKFFSGIFQTEIAILPEGFNTRLISFAAKTRDGGEVLGQLFRLGLVPIGHLFQRLPLGNIGRANVSAFQSMPVAPKLTELITIAKSMSQIGL